MSELARVMTILMANKKKQFVQRVLRPKEYPSFDLGKGKTGTHLMSADTTKAGKHIVYPHLVYDERKGKLQRFSRQSAMMHAESTGEFIEFEDLKDAVWFSKRYKEVWKPQHRRPK